MSRVHALGIDVGSTTVKAVGVNGKCELIWHLLEQTDPLVQQQVMRLFSRARHDLGSLDDVPIVSTGYGRDLVQQAARSVTEITCHARGMFTEFMQGGTLIDIGGQDSKIIAVDPVGNVTDFNMNDKCAAGTGRFLEYTAARLAVPLTDMGNLALATNEEIPISSTCTVFAESEIISLVAQGVPVSTILRGLSRALVRRIVPMIHTVTVRSPLVLAGGVALNPAICCMLEEEIEQPAMLPSHPQLLGAQGAALIALEQL